MVKRLASFFMGGNSRAFSGPFLAIAKALASSGSRGSVGPRRDEDMERTARTRLREAKCEKEDKESENEMAEGTRGPTFGHPRVKEQK